MSTKGETQNAISSCINLWIILISAINITVIFCCLRPKL